MRKYLKTIEDIEALRNTDTKIYRDKSTGYHKFVNGVLCFFTCEGEDKLFTYNTTLGDLEDHYIIVEDSKDYSEYVGKLGWFWDYGKEDEGFIDVLEKIVDEDSDKYIPHDSCGFQHFCPLTPREVEAYTGYKVMKEK